MGGSWAVACEWFAGRLPPARNAHMQASRCGMEHHHERLQQPLVLLSQTPSFTCAYVPERRQMFAEREPWARGPNGACTLNPDFLRTDLESTPILRLLPSLKVIAFS